MSFEQDSLVSAAPPGVRGRDHASHGDPHACILKFKFEMSLFHSYNLSSHRAGHSHPEVELMRLFIHFIGGWWTSATLTFGSDPEVGLKCLINIGRSSFRRILKFVSSEDNRETPSIFTIRSSVFAKNDKFFPNETGFQLRPLAENCFTFRFVVERQIRGSAVRCMLHVNACCRQASTMDFRELTPHTIQYLKTLKFPTRTADPNGVYSLEQNPRPGCGEISSYLGSKSIRMAVAIAAPIVVQILLISKATISYLKPLRRSQHRWVLECRPDFRPCPDRVPKAAVDVLHAIAHVSSAQSINQQHVAMRLSKEMPRNRYVLVGL
ncbi:hypothetical protein EVAR_92828_1 [Eumeta japonica]|uniref:Uncharacterized protein n=1 Tax=Eumeta variegata TaxID=151549 RepID=A0A4C1TD14_EUMVA|nr:hypothetical protein EVAR_92828_1 [Eumeta japonica]